MTQEQVEFEVLTYGDTRAFVFFVGKQFYNWPHLFGDEVRHQGFSRILPEGQTTDLRRTDHFIVVHPRAGVRSGLPNGLGDLCMELVSEYVPEPDDEVKQALADAWHIGPENWQMAYCCQFLYDPETKRNRPDLSRLLEKSEADASLPKLFEKYAAEFYIAAFGYGPITGLQYVMKPDETELPERLRGKGIQPVRVSYIEEEGEYEQNEE